MWKMENRKLLLVQIFINLVTIPLFSQNNDNTPENLYKKLEQSRDTSHIDVLLDLSWYYMKKQTDSSANYAKLALDEAVELNDLMRQMKAHNALGISYSNSGELKSSIEHNIKAYELAVKLKCNKYLPSYLKNISNGYFQMRELDLALSYLQKTITEADKQKDFEVEISAYISSSDIYFRKKNIQLADSYSQKALDLALEIKDTVKLSHVYSSIGEQRTLNEKFDEAVDYFLKSLALRKKNDEYGRIKCYVFLTQNYIYLKQFNLASMYLDKADTLVTKNKILSQQVNITMLRSKLLENTGNYKEALAVYKKYLSIRDSLHSKEKEDAINKLQVKFDTGQKEKELEKIRIQVDTERIKRRTFLIISIILLFVIIFAISNVRKRNKMLLRENENTKEKILLEQEKIRNIEEKSLLARQKDEQQKQQEILEKERILQELERAELEQKHLAMELDEKHRSLLTSTMQNEQQKEFLLELKTSIIQLKSITDKREWISAIDQLAGLLGSKISQANDWDKIKLYFEKVHPGFFEKLKDTFPNLSINELKFCAYTKMNLTGKEISRLLNINPNSVHISRYRLKRKMELAEDVNFTDYILKNF